MKPLRRYRPQKPLITPAKLSPFYLLSPRQRKKRMKAERREVKRNGQIIIDDPLRPGQVIGDLLCSGQILIDPIRP